MDNPQQHLIHLTSRGPKVYGQDGAVGKFKCVTTQPLKDINKFGLLHYSIPKQIDPLTRANNSFDLRLRFHAPDANGRDTFNVTVTLPELDYNNVLVSSEVDHTLIDGWEATYQDRAYASAARINAPTRNKAVLHFDEILQSSINWALMEEYDRLNGGAAAPAGTVGMQMLGRISCIVKYDEGRYKFQFGYRGYGLLQNDADPGTRAYAPGAIANSGAPFPVAAVANAIDEQGNAYVPAAPIAAGLTGVLVFRTPGGHMRNNDPCVPLTINQAYLVGVDFVNIPMRIQMMMGAGAAALGHTRSYPANTLVTRGRIRLVNYVDAGGGQLSGLHEIEMTLPPNLDPPSMLYLQLTVPGTRTKILGQQDERGGWAIPTPSNAYLSKWDNLPNAGRYTMGQARYMPIVDANNNAIVQLETFFADAIPPAAPAGMGAADGDRWKRMHRDGLGYNYDPIPHAGTAPVGGLRPVNDWGAATCSFIRFRTPTTRKRARCTPRTTLGGNASSGFGTGLHRANPCFTTSMIEPNYIYTQTTDSTIQTFDIELLWGDTSEPVQEFNGHPVQLSIIASS